MQIQLSRQLQLNTWGQLSGFRKYAHTRVYPFVEFIYSTSTESYDVMDPVGTDPRWEVFYKLSEHLLKTYPKTYVKLLAIFTFATKRVILVMQL